MSKTPEPIESERRTIAGVLMRPATLVDLRDEITPDAFTRLPERRAWMAMLALDADGIAIDPATVTDRMVQGGYNGLEAGQFISDCMAVGVTIGPPTWYAAEVKRAWRERRIRAELRALADSDLGADAIVARAYERIEQLDDRPVEVYDGKRLSQIARDDAEEAWTYAQRDEARPGIYTGFDDLDAAVAPFSPGDLVLIGAGTSKGKTALMWSMAIQMASQGTPVGYISLEDGVTQMARRAMSKLGRVEIGKVKRGELGQADFSRIMAGLTKLHGLPLYLVDESGLTAAQVASRLRYLQRKHGIKAGFVDYVQQLGTEPGKYQNRHLEIGAGARTLRGAAKRLGITAFLGSQLVKEAQDRTPKAADLKESGDLKDKADYVILLDRDREKDPGTLRCLLAKAKDAAVHTVELAFVDRYASVENKAKGGAVEVPWLGG